VAFLVYLIYFFVSGINKWSSGTSTDFIAPETQVTGRLEVYVSYRNS
jgi:hypothetical protein